MSRICSKLIEVGESNEWNGTKWRYVVLCIIQLPFQVYLSLGTISTVTFFDAFFRRLANDIKSVWYHLLMGTHTEINLACLLTNRSAKYVGQKSKNEANAVYMKTVK